MSETTKIEWCDSTFNPVIGCTKVSPGCTNCYADAQDRFRKWTPEGWGPGRPRKLTSAANWRQPIKWNAEHESFFAAHGRCRRVFSASLSDWLDHEWSIQWRADFLALVAATPNLDWLLLTKRPEQWHQSLFDVGETADARNNRQLFEFVTDWLSGKAPRNVWLGVTAENQMMAYQRIPLLLSIPAAVRFVSVEPLLGPIEFEQEWIEPEIQAYGAGVTTLFPRLAWVIVGGESGHNARPMHPDWARDLRDQCKAANVPFLFKQWGNHGASGVNMTTLNPEFRMFESKTQWANKAGTWMLQGDVCIDFAGKICGHGADFETAKYPVAIMRPMPKKKAGRLLDGVEHNEFPRLQQ